MPNYMNGKIYMLTNGSGLNYYGSTTQKLSSRMSGHRATYKKYKEKKIGKQETSRLLFDKDFKGTKIILVENFPCSSKYELEKRERFYIDNNECVNKCIPKSKLKKRPKNV